MTTRTPEWYRRQAEKMLEQAEAAERLEALLAVDGEFGHGTVLRFSKRWPSLGSHTGPCVYAVVKVVTLSGQGDGWYRTGRRDTGSVKTCYTWRELLEWIGTDALDTVEVMEPGHRLFVKEEEKST